MLVESELRRGKRVNSVSQAIDVIDQHPDGVRDGPGSSRWLWGHRLSP